MTVVEVMNGDILASVVLGSGFSSQECFHYLVSLYDAVVAFRRWRLPAQPDGVVLFMVHCHGHRQRGCTGD